MACHVHVTREVIPQTPELSQGWVQAGWWLEIHSVEPSVHRDTASNRAHQENTAQPRKTWRDSEPRSRHSWSQLARVHSSQEASVGLGKIPELWASCCQLYKWGGSKSNNNSYFSCLDLVIYLGLLCKKIPIQSLFLKILRGKLSSVPGIKMFIHWPVLSHSFFDSLWPHGL